MSLVVVKLSGKICDSGAALASVADDLAQLHAQGRRMVVVHGGGRQLDELAARLDVPQHTAFGRRITCARTLELAMMTLGGAVNMRLTAALRARGLSAVGLSGVDGRTFRAKRRPETVTPEGETIDWGFVGDVRGDDPSLIEMLVARGSVPVLSSLCADDDGVVLNVNADTIASELAILLHAERIVSLSDTTGVYLDPKDEATLVPQLDLAGCRRLLASGAATAGMLPKLAGVLAALERGVDKVQLIDGRKPQALAAAFSKAGAGTTITRKAFEVHA